MVCGAVKKSCEARAADVADVGVYASGGRVQQGLSERKECSTFDTTNGGLLLMEANELRVPQYRWVADCSFFRAL